MKSILDKFGLTEEDLSLYLSDEEFIKLYEMCGGKNHDKMIKSGGKGKKTDKPKKKKVTKEDIFKYATHEEIKILTKESPSLNEIFEAHAVDYITQSLNLILKGHANSENIKEVLSRYTKGRSSKIIDDLISLSKGSISGTQIRQAAMEINKNLVNRTSASMTKLADELNKMKGQRMGGLAA